MIKAIIIVANTSKSDTQVVFLSSCNIQLQEWTMPSNQIAFNSAFWLADTVDAVATGRCKNLGKLAMQAWSLVCVTGFDCPKIHPDYIQYTE